MKTKKFQAIILLGLTPLLTNAQALTPKECKQTVSIFYEAYKAKNYQEAFEPWQKAFTACPKEHVSIYAYAKKILKTQIKATKNEAEKKKFAEMLVQSYDKRLENFPNPKKTNGILGEKAAAMLTYKIGTTMEAFNILDDIFQKEGVNMKAASLFSYFQAGIKLRKDPKFGGDQRVFDIYDNVLLVIEKNIEKNTQISNELHAQEADLDKKQKKALKKADVSLENFKKFEKGINKMIAPLATCERLDAIFYNGQKTKPELLKDEKWLSRAVTMLGRKKCYKTDAYLIVAEAYYSIKPTAKSARAIAKLAYQKDKDMKKALKYFKEAAKMEEDPNKKAEDLLLVATVNLSNGQKQSAKSTALKAAKLRKNWGDPYMLIGDAYATAANECGKSEFEKKAVYWAAVEKFEYAAKIDRSVAKKALKKANSYRKLAPDKTMIFQQGKGQKSMPIKCWVNETVKIPEL